MAVLEALGINSTIWIQLGLFLFTYVFLHFLVFKPYIAAFEARENKTTGQMGLADELNKKTKDLYEEYETKSRHINKQIQTIFDSFRDEAQEEHLEIVSKAKTESEQIIAESRKQIQQQIGKAKEDYKAQVPQISQTVVEKLIGREI